MRRRTFTELAAALASACFCVALCIAPAGSICKTEGDTVTVHISPAAVDADEGETEVFITDAEKTEDAVPDADTEMEYTHKQLEARFISMLDMNYCYGDSFKDPDKMAVASAITLLDYASDIPGYGICVNKSLVAGFAASFYGVRLNCSEIGSGEAPEGTVMTPCTEVGTQYHQLDSITKTDNGYEVLTLVTFYYGGNDTETRLARSVFAENQSSEFGFNLISCVLI